MRQMRLFVAVNFPDKIKKTLGSVINELRRLPSGAKWVDEENLHLTVQFLGNVPEEQAPAVTDALKRSADGIPAFRLILAGVGVFPSVERPRVLWAGFSGDTSILISLHRRVEKEMEKIGFTPENRRYLPHLTLARIRTPAGFQNVFEEAKQLAEKCGSFGSAEIGSVDLMRSELGPRGSKYYKLAAIPLKGLALV